MVGVRTAASSGLLVAVLCPYVTYAAVLINEIAWMGTETSANDEWIELRNTGESSVLLEGWTLTSSGGLEVELSGALSPGAYGVLERTDDTSAPGAMLMQYTGALSNGGDTLTLTNEHGATEDQVAGGEGWEYIGGDNSSKATAQRTTNGWIAAESTPGAANKVEDAVDSADSSTTDTTDDDAENTDEAVHEPKVSVSDIVITAPSRAYVNQSIDLRAEPRDEEGRLVRYSWSFGDTATSSAKTPEHTYTHSGNYVVMVEAYYAKEFITARHEIVVLPANLSVSTAEGGDIQVHNDARYEIDVSGFIIEGGRTVTMPEHTILLPGATLTIARERIAPYARVRVLDPSGAMVATYDPTQRHTEELEQSAVPESHEVSHEIPAPTATSTPASTTNRFGLVEEHPNPEEPMITQSAASVSKAGQTDPDAFTYAALAGVLILGIAGVYLRT